MTMMTLLISGMLSVQAVPTSCESLQGLALEDAAITSAHPVAEGTTVGRGGSGAPLPAYCRVEAVLTPSPDSHIEMEIWLPSEDTWNGKFLAVGNGGWAGSISTGAIASGLADGYAAASSDMGNQGSGGGFVSGHPEKVIDFADRATHELAVQSAEPLI